MIKKEVINTKFNQKGVGLISQIKYEKKNTEESENICKFCSIIVKLTHQKYTLIRCSKCLEYFHQMCNKNNHKTGKNRILSKSICRECLENN